MSRVSDDDRRELPSCRSCRTPTELVCPRHNVPLCEGCECEWVYERQSFEHIVTAPGTPWLRWYMSCWPDSLPPPRVKRYARSVHDVLDVLDYSLDTVARSLAVVWDRDDALLAIAERAIYLHERDAIAIDGWNEYVRKENAKRKHRRLRGWRNKYYSRALRHPRE